VADRQLAAGGKGLLPIFNRLGGKIIHEVNAKPMEAGVIGCMNCMDGGVGGVAAAEKPKETIVECLDTDAKAIDTCSSKSMHLLGCNLFRVGFERDLWLLIGEEKRFPNPG